MESGPKRSAQGEEDSAVAAGANPFEGLLGDFLVAVRSLTIFPLGVSEAPARMGREAGFYPLVGLAIGAALVLLDLGLRLAFSQELTSVMLVAALAVLSGGRHLDGFGNTADGLIGAEGREDALAAMHERPLGTFGTAAVVFLLIAKVRCFDLLSGDVRFVALLLAPVAGRWAMVVLVHGSREAGSPDGAKKFAPDVSPREFAMGSVIALLALLGTAQALGLLVAVVSAAVAVALRLYFHHRLGGVTRHTLGAVAEVVETVALLLFAFASPSE
jgi:adenosylcobinamide-GDP ribazoletransferase